MGLQDQQLDDLFALRDVHPGPARRPLEDRLPDRVGVRRRRRPGVYRDARRLGLQPHPRLVRDDLLDRLLDPGAQVDQFGSQPLDEPDVELRPVAAHQVYLAGQPGQRRQVAQCPAGHHGHRGLRQRGQRPYRGDGLG